MVLAQLHVYLNFGHILNAPAILFNQITSIHNDNFEVINSCCIMIRTYSAREYKKMQVHSQNTSS